MPSRRRLLLVEDDRDTRAALFELFTRAGYSVLTADDGQQALDLLMRGVRPRLMVVDLLLPNVSGTEFLKYIETDPELRDTPRVVITALSKGNVHVVVDVVFHKPFEANDLLEAVKKIAPPGAHPS